MNIYQNKTFNPNDLYAELCKIMSPDKFEIKYEQLIVNVIDDMFIRFRPDNLHKFRDGTCESLTYVIYDSVNESIRRGDIYMNTTIYQKEHHRIFMRSYLTMKSLVEYLTKDNEIIVNELLNKIFNILEIDGELKI